MSTQFSIKFRGVRGSYPVPGKRTVKYGGNTSCIEINIGNNTVVCDSGTGIIQLGAELIKKMFENDGKPIKTTIVFTHMHHDHTQGFPFFAPAFIPTSTLYLFGPKLHNLGIKEIFKTIMQPNCFPVDFNELNALKIIEDVSEKNIIFLPSKEETPVLAEKTDFQIFKKYNKTDVGKIHILKSYSHPKGGSFVYKIEFMGKSVVIATDVEGYVGGDQRLIAFSRNADILIHDAQYTEESYSKGVPSTQGFGHSTYNMAIDVAKKANVKKLILFHHDPSHDDETISKIERKANKIFPGTIAAYEGLKINLIKPKL